MLRASSCLLPHASTQAAHVARAGMLPGAQHLWDSVQEEGRAQPLWGQQLYGHVSHCPTSQLSGRARTSVTASRKMAGLSSRRAATSLAEVLPLGLPMGGLPSEAGASLGTGGGPCGCAAPADACCVRGDARLLQVHSLAD